MDKKKEKPKANSVGRPKNIKSPDELWEHFCNYKTDTKANPRKRMVFGGKDFNKDYELLERPLTIEGFENYCFEKDIISDLGDYFKNKEGRYSDFAPICSRIKSAIRQDQIEGGLVGQYNPSITQRLNGLTEKVEAENKNDNKHEIVVKFEQ